MAGNAYCTRPELAIWGAPADAFSDIEPEQQDKAIASSTTRIDGYIATRVNLPLLSWGDDIRRACAVIATYDLIPATRGRNPEEAGDRDPIYDRYKDVLAWLQAIKDGEVQIPEAVGSPVAPPAADTGISMVTSNRQRGWQGDSSSCGPGDAFTGRRR